MRREEANAAILKLASDGIAIKEIARRTGHSRGVIRKVLRGQRSDIFRSRESSLDIYLPWLDAQWTAGEQNGAALWRKLKSQGYRGSLRVVTEWATRRRRADQVSNDALRRSPSARTIARLMTVKRDDLSKAETIVAATIEAKAPLLVEARDIIGLVTVLCRSNESLELVSGDRRDHESLRRFQA